MKKFFMRETKRFNRYLSLLLVVTLLAGIIPEGVYANGDRKTAKTTVNTGSRMGNQQENQAESQPGNQTNSQETAEGKQDAGLKTTLTEEQRGLYYAVLATEDFRTKVKAHCIRIQGNVHVNQNFFYSGDKIQVKGSLEAGEKILLHTSQGRRGQLIGRRVEKAGAVRMPDFVDEIYDYVKTNGTHYFRCASFEGETSMQTPFV